MSATPPSLTTLSLIPATSILTFREPENKHVAEAPTQKPFGFGDFEAAGFSPSTTNAVSAAAENAFASMGAGLARMDSFDGTSSGWSAIPQMFSAAPTTRLPNNAAAPPLAPQSTVSLFETGAFEKIVKKAENKSKKEKTESPLTRCPRIINELLDDLQELKPIELTTSKILIVWIRGILSRFNDEKPPIAAWIALRCAHGNEDILRQSGLPDSVKSIAINLFGEIETWMSAIITKVEESFKSEDESNDNADDDIKVSFNINEECVAADGAGEGNDFFKKEIKPEKRSLRPRKGKKGKKIRPLQIKQAQTAKTEEMEKVADEDVLIARRDKEKADKEQSYLADFKEHMLTFVEGLETLQTGVEKVMRSIMIKEKWIKTKDAVINRMREKDLVVWKWQLIRVLHIKCKDQSQAAKKLDPKVDQEKLYTRLLLESQELYAGSVKTIAKKLKTQKSYYAPQSDF